MATSPHIRRPQPGQHERRGNATSPSERAPDASMPHNDTGDTGI
jgi:hypothetical protein